MIIKCVSHPTTTLSTNNYLLSQMLSKQKKNIKKWIVKICKIYFFDNVLNSYYRELLLLRNNVNSYQLATMVERWHKIIVLKLCGARLIKAY